MITKGKSDGNQYNIFLIATYVADHGMLEKDFSIGVNVEMEKEGHSNSSNIFRVVFLVAWYAELKLEKLYVLPNLGPLSLPLWQWSLKST